MKKFLILPASILIAFFTSAQKSAYQAPNMPVDEETKLITYSNVIEVPSTGKSELYKRAESWMMTYFKNPTEVIRERDSSAAKITGKPRFRIYNEPGENGVKMDAGLVQYSLTFACKENKYKYTISEINWKQASYFPVEKWVEQKDRYKQNNYFLFQTDSIIKKEIIQNFEKAMKTAPKKSNKDDW